METCHHNPHAAFSMQLRVARIMKCRKKLLWDEETPFSVREICRQEDAEIVKDHASQNHVRLLAPFRRKAAGRLLRARGIVNCAAAKAMLKAETA